MLSLHSFGSEQVSMLRIAAAREHSLEGNPGGTEIFVVSGSVEYKDDSLPAESWLRLPAGEAATVKAHSDSVLWVKCGHLPPTGTADN